METFCLNYKLEDAGWAIASVAFEGNTVDMRVSYLHDTLRELAEAAISLVNGAVDARVLLIDEPGEHQLYLERAANDDLRFEIRWYEDWASWGMHSSKKYELRLKGTTSVRRFRHEVLNVLWNLNQDYGPAKYKEMWLKHEFPTVLYAQLEKS